MKRLFLFAILLATSLVYVQSQKLIALQNGSKAFFHQRLDSIMVHAAAGDTIYLPGVNYNYGQDFTINKELHIFGVGHYPDSTLATGYTGIQNHIRFVNGSNNSTISGIYVGGNIYFGTNTADRTVSNVAISRCSVGGITLNYDFDVSGATTSYITIRENVIRGDLSGGYTSNNVAVERNIITHYVKYFTYPANTYLKNNLLLNRSGYEGTAFIYVYGILVENNVIMALDPLNATHVNQCTFKNNMFNANAAFTNGANGTNTGTNNIANVAFAGLFVNYAELGIFQYDSPSAFAYLKDFHLVATSPGKNAGSDGTDIGLYGSTTPYKTIPANPHVVTSNNADHVINGKLGVNVSVQAQTR